VPGINWQDLQKAAGDAAFTPLPNDVYDVFVDEAEATKTSTDKDMIKVKFKVTNGPHEGRGIFNQFVISPDSANALAFFFRHMAALGLDEAFFAANPPLQQVAAALVGRACRVKVGTREYQGTDRNEVQAVLPPTPGTATTAPPAPTPMPTTPPSPGTPAAPPVGVGPTPMPVAPPVAAPPVSPAPAAPELPF
jgi:hypothetical protein